MNLIYKSLALESDVQSRQTQIAIRVYGVANSEEQQAFLGWRRAMR